ncbi:hypothetical protein BJ085DRAFT_31520 [Dimargaris cristalligena]|uniref:Uncharacterized protein n=1 Tax=Dimargaris cristalligena TaxID=215637 RepID=A0A4P9ZPF7_9FUNG|nr:hypothetical protein BJ085DRAFT_31520 [Dimargaris cristalligena]|eukprot:RKP34462.1 hypothetical protein BJ085DRAFT_31520 [Dimargaris cristalligena]
MVQVFPKCGLLLKASESPTHWQLRTPARASRGSDISPAEATMSWTSSPTFNPSTGTVRYGHVEYPVNPSTSSVYRHQIAGPPVNGETSSQFQDSLSTQSVTDYHSNPARNALGIAVNVQAPLAMPISTQTDDAFDGQVWEHSARAINTTTSIVDVFLTWPL